MELEARRALVANAVESEGIADELFGRGGYLATDVLHRELRRVSVADDTIEILPADSWQITGVFAPKEQGL